MESEIEVEAPQPAGPPEVRRHAADDDHLLPFRLLCFASSLPVRLLCFFKSHQTCPAWSDRSSMQKEGGRSTPTSNKHDQHRRDLACMHDSDPPDLCAGNTGSCSDKWALGLG